MDSSFIVLLSKGILFFFLSDGDSYRSPKFLFILTLEPGIVNLLSM